MNKWHGIIKKDIIKKYESNTKQKRTGKELEG